VILNSDPSAQSAWEHLLTPAFSELVQPEPTATYRFAETAKYLQIRARRNDHGLASHVCRNLGSLEGHNRELVNTFSILTTTPNAVTSPVHDRMPVILNPYGYDLWLDPGINDVATASDLLKPFDARLMRCYPVNRVNHVGKDDEECSPTCGEGQNRLFV
jgi:hypothetical protein